MTEYTPLELLFFSLCTVGAAMSVLALGIGIVYIFGGKKIRKQIREEW